MAANDTNIADADKKEIERLRSSHALYQQYAPEWDMYLAAYEGGPDFANEKRIFKHFRENQDDFTDRANRLHYINYCDQIVDFYTNFIFAETIDRNGGDSGAFYDTFVKNVDKKQTSVNDYMRDVSDEVQIFGMLYTYVEAPPTPAGVVELTKQDEQDFKLSPYWVMWRPNEVLDWVVDDFDVFTYVKRRQLVNRVAASGSVSTFEKYTEFYQDKIRTTEIDISDPSKPQLGVPVEAVNSMGKIPLYVHRFKRSKRYPFMGNSFLRDFAYNNREIMNLTSLLQEFLYRQCFNILAKETDAVIPLQSQNEGEVGTSNVIEVPKGASMPTYLSPPADPAKFIQSERQMIKQEMFSRASQDAMNELFNGEGKSGFSQAQSFSKTVPFIARRADLLEAAENALMSLTMERMSKEWKGRVKYKDHYEITNVQDAMTQFITLARDLAIDSEDFVKAELKRFVKEYDGKLSTETINKIEAEIDKMDFEAWKQLQQDALIGRPTSPGDQQKSKSSGTMAEVQAEAKSPSTAGTKKIKGK
jgi:hypothetical protein